MHRAAMVPSFVHGSLRRRLLVTALSAVLAGAGVARAASFPPDLRFRSVSTPRVTVHYHQGLEAMARAGGRPGHRDPRGARSALRRPRRARADRARRRGGRSQRLRHAAARTRWCRCAPWPPTAATTSATTTTGCASCSPTSWPTSSTSTRRAACSGCGRKVLGRAPFLFPNAVTPDLDGRGPGHLRGDAGHRLRPRPQPRRAHGAAHGGAGGRLPARGPRGGRPRPLAGRPGRRTSSARPSCATSSRASGPQTLPELARVHSGRVIPYLDELHRAQGHGRHLPRAVARVARPREQRRSRRRRTRVRARGLTASRALTDARHPPVRRRASARTGSGSPTPSRSLTRFRAIRLVRPRRQRRPQASSTATAAPALAWTPDGPHLVFDEPESFRLFSRAVGPARRWTWPRGRARLSRAGCARASRTSRPTAAPSCSCGSSADRSELALVGRDGGGPARPDALRAGHAVERPRWSPAGRRARGVALDARRLARHRARRPRPRARSTHADPRPRQGRGAGLDAGRRPRRLPLRPRRGLEPLRRARRRRRALRVTNVLGGAFTPDVSPGRPRARLRGLRRARLRRARDGPRPAALRAGRPLRGSVSRAAAGARAVGRARPALSSLRRCSCRGSGRRTSTARRGETKLRRGHRRDGRPVPPRLGRGRALGTDTDRVGRPRLLPVRPVPAHAAVAVEDESDPAARRLDAHARADRCARRCRCVARSGPRRRVPRPGGGAARRSRARASPSGSTWAAWRRPGR